MPPVQRNRRDHRLTSVRESGWEDKAFLVDFKNTDGPEGTFTSSFSIDYPTLLKL